MPTVIQSDQFTKRIKLSRGMFAIVDDSDYALLSQFTWHAIKNVRSNLYYAMRHRSVSEQGLGLSPRVMMHREILSPLIYQDVDHLNHNGLDNRRANIRVCNPSQNQANSRRRIGKSGYRGVVPDKAGKFRACLGGYATARDAAIAYDYAMVKLYGEFALTNRSLGLL